jgi:hypothetical protein
MVLTDLVLLVAARTIIPTGTHYRYLENAMAILVQTMSGASLLYRIFFTYFFFTTT